MEADTQPGWYADDEEGERESEVFVLSPGPGKLRVWQTDNVKNDRIIVAK